MQRKDRQYRNFVSVDDFVSGNRSNPTGDAYDGGAGVQDVILDPSNNAQPIRKIPVVPLGDPRNMGLEVPEVQLPAAPLSSGSNIPMPIPTGAGGGGGGAEEKPLAAAAKPSNMKWLLLFGAVGVAGFLYFKN